MSIWRRLFETKAFRKTSIHCELFLSLHGFVYLRLRRLGKTGIHCELLLCLHGGVYLRLRRLGKTGIHCELFPSLYLRSLFWLFWYERHLLLAILYLYRITQEKYQYNTQKYTYINCVHTTFMICISACW